MFYPIHFLIIFIYDNMRYPKKRSESCIQASLNSCFHSEVFLNSVQDRGDLLMSESYSHNRLYLKNGEKKLTGLRILVIDDDESILLILSKMLQIMGLQVTTASNGKTGLEHFLDGSYDFVITDMEMPGMDGLSLSQKIKERHQDTPIIMITGNPEINSGNSMVSVDDLVFKPFLFKDIQESLLRLMRKELDANDSKYLS